MIVFLVLVLCLLAWGCKCDCDDDMSKKRNQYGNPEEADSYSSTGYRSETWWYWSQGVSFTFEWGADVKTCCEVSTYTFEPISDQKDEVTKKKVRLARTAQKKSHTFGSAIITR